MSLRNAILTHALPHIPTTSFTRSALTSSLAQLPKEHPDHRAEAISDQLLDTLYGPDRGPEKELVRRWADEGVITAIRGPHAGGEASGSAAASGAGKRTVTDRIGERLARRLRYSGMWGSILSRYVHLLLDLLHTPQHHGSYPRQDDYSGRM